MNVKALLSEHRTQVIILLIVLFLLIVLIKKAREMKEYKTIKKMPSQWNVSPQGYEHIKRWEGVRNKAYKDSAGLWTIGIGHLIKPNESHLLSTVLSDAQIMDLFYKDVEAKRKIVNAKIKVPITQGLYDALISLAYNTGTIYTYIIQLVEAGDYQALAARWRTTAITVNNGAKVIQGLKNRRASEVKLFT